MKYASKMLAMLCVSLLVAATAQAGLISHFGMNEGSGTTTADAVSGNDSATFTSSPAPAWSTDGANGSSHSIDFSGSGGILTVDGTTPTDYVKTGSAFTIDFYMKSSEALSGNDFQSLAYLESDNTTVFGGVAVDDFVIALSSMSAYQGIAFGARAGHAFVPLHTSGVTTGDLTDGQWHNIVITYNGSGSLTAGNFALSIDGNSKTLVGAGNFQMADGTRFGGQAVSTFVYGGKLDEFKITPEPATMSLLGIGGLLALVRRRRK